ncbi:hypothetical protein NG895_23445 [Aeoliella sp. ICT_H6.2]|uniref:Uncharacterized protein n=1 Tax=Aeoliella straminimaris TaxID=2954799 RepID=A0A9X2FDA3_9BACT|nr:hypothetical protein [Aeoliella straminimaris]MCO6046865.1 hypothetical protein [Aeoliella straminimaris]
MEEDYFMPLCDEEAKLFRKAISERGYSLKSLADAIWNRHYSDGQTTWLPRPESLYAALTTGWMSGRIALSGELVSHIEAETGVSLAEVFNSKELGAEE